MIPLPLHVFIYLLYCHFVECFDHQIYLLIPSSNSTDRANPAPHQNAPPSTTCWLPPHPSPKVLQMRKPNCLLPTLSTCSTALTEEPSSSRCWSSRFWSCSKSADEEPCSPAPTTWVWVFTTSCRRSYSPCSSHCRQMSLHRTQQFAANYFEASSALSCLHLELGQLPSKGTSEQMWGGWVRKISENLVLSANFAVWADGVVEVSIEESEVGRAGETLQQGHPLSCHRASSHPFQG